MRALFVAGLEPVNERDVHPADEADRAGLRGVSRDHPDQKRPFVLLEHQAGDVRRIGHRVNQHEMEPRVILRHFFQDRPLGEPHAGNEVVAVLSESPQRRLDRGRVARLDVAQDDREIFFRAQYARVRGGVERAVILAADVEDDADLLFSGVGLGDEIARGAAAEWQRTTDQQNPEINASHAHWLSLIRLSGAGSGARGAPFCGRGDYRPLDSPRATTMKKTLRLMIEYCENEGPG